MERTHGGSLLGSATPRYPREGGATECRPRRSRVLVRALTLRTDAGLWWRASSLTSLTWKTQ